MGLISSCGPAGVALQKRLQVDGDGDPAFAAVRAVLIGGGQGTWAGGCASGSMTGLD